MKQFFETDYQEASQHRQWLDSLIVILTDETEVAPADGFKPPVVEFEDPAIARARVAVALGLLPIDVAIKEGVIIAESPDTAQRIVDSLALRLRQRLYPEAYDVTYSRVIRAVPGLSDADLEKVPSSLSGVGQETIVTPHPLIPQDGDPLFDKLNTKAEEDNKAARAAKGAAPADGDSTAAALKGELPEGFPALGALAALDPPVHTYHQVRKLISAGIGWYKDLPGIGKPTAEKIEAAAGAAPVEEEE